MVSTPSTRARAASSPAPPPSSPTCMPFYKTFCIIWYNMMRLCNRDTSPEPADAARAAQGGRDSIAWPHQCQHEYNHAIWQPCDIAMQYGNAMRRCDSMAISHCHVPHQYQSHTALAWPHQHWHRCQHGYSTVVWMSILASSWVRADNAQLYYSVYYPDMTS